MKINTSFLSRKSEDEVLRVREIYCESYNECSFYKEGKCLMCTDKGVQCKFGKMKTVRGYSRKSRNYSSFVEKYESDSTFNKLKYPNNLVAIIGDYIFLNLRGVCVYSDGIGSDGKTEYSISKTIIEEGSYIPLVDVSADLLNKVFSNEWVSDMIVCDMLIDIKKLLPEIYDILVISYSKYCDKLSYTGRRAYVNSLLKGTVIDVEGTKWYYDGEYLIAEDFDLGLKSPWWGIGSGKAYVKIEVDDAMLFEIKNMSVVHEGLVLE